MLFEFSNQVQNKGALQSCFYKMVLWKNVANLQENTHAEVRFQ